MSTPRFAVGDRVRVQSQVEGGNRRTPDYTKGRTGTVTASHGVINNPLDHHHAYPPLYTVVFGVDELMGRATHDLVAADLHEEWLEQE